ncbi:BAR domain-containing protein [Coemansia sp. RSA 564]|nr:BAR domain-containing protein [Coemansia sp. RSA 564]KAJ2250667.1 BAR domain-containing protein [Coemansia sp. RSA 475]KAJ2265222.1 BAR domain-containing protein [Coemansia sp. RSA 371]KAJ2408008.1 BAR domain-containing protein [Coemansia sp. RSA 2526]KAJ2435636.1 BAR domain-containing protein [Coemansia sp. RSA 2522]KAJ2593277.1 BAR domain-containing protein [Coemansia sp. RSA 1797]
MDKFAKFTQNVSTSWTPFANKVGSSFTQYKQMATESLGSAQVTELPRDYIELEARYEAVRRTVQSLVRQSTQYSASQASFDVQAQLATLTTRMGKQTRDASGPQEVLTEQHEMGRTALTAAEPIGLEAPLGAALFKFGSIETKVGDLRRTHNTHIQRSFISPLQDMLDTSMGLAQNARKHVQAMRLTLDARKAALQGANAGQVDGVRREVEHAEDAFVEAVSEGMRVMRAVVESPVLVACVGEIVKAQKVFYKEAAELLAELEPEIEEIKVTQDALYRHDNPM